MRRIEAAKEHQELVRLIRLQTGKAVWEAARLNQLTDGRDETRPERMRMSKSRTASRTLGAIAATGEAPEAKRRRRGGEIWAEGELQHTAQLAFLRVITRTRALHNNRQVSPPHPINTGGREGASTTNLERSRR